MKHLILVAAALLAACSSSTTIQIADPDARIYIDGEYRGMGKTPHSDRKLAFTGSRSTRSITTMSSTASKSRPRGKLPER